MSLVPKLTLSDRRHMSVPYTALSNRAGSCGTIRTRSEPRLCRQRPLGGAPERRAGIPFLSPLHRPEPPETAAGSKPGRTSPVSREVGGAQDPVQHQPSCRLWAVPSRWRLLSASCSCWSGCRRLSAWSVNQTAGKIHKHIRV